MLQPPRSNPNFTTPVDRVLSHLEGTRRSGAGWTARCPNHDDRQASLSVKEGDDGRVLLHCFASCANADIVMSAGLSFPDLFPPRSRERFKPRAWKGTITMNPNGRPALASFGDDQVAALLGEVARLAFVRGTLDKRITAALRVVSAACGVDHVGLALAVDAAIATDEPA
ncbi:MAG TPA: hypothetical protein VIN65_10690 [Candidatus Dormibacteraeota bacterium]